VNRTRGDVPNDAEARKSGSLRRPSGNQRHRLIIAGAVAGVAFVIATAVVVSAAQSGSDGGIQKLNALATRGPDTAVVAIVNGQAITRREIDIDAAMLQSAQASGASGQDIAAVSKEDLLNNTIDDVLLAQAATKAGVVVTEAEVSQMINAGIVAPLSSSSTPENIRKLSLAALAANGVSLANVETDPGARAAFREFELDNRYVGLSKQSRAELVAAAKATATIQTFPDVLNASR
jgi:hypothetical protein